MHRFPDGRGGYRTADLVPIGHVRGHDAPRGSDIVDVYVRHLRRSLGPGFVTTVRGIGHRAES